MAYTLPSLPYAFNALEPHIDAKTMEIHHGKHHNAYVTNLNKALEGRGIAEQSIEDLCRNIEKIPEDIRTAVRNNGGGHAESLDVLDDHEPNGGGKPGGDLAKAIDSELGGFDKFKEQFTNSAITRFGSGWAWLSVEKSGKLVVESTPNQDNPVHDRQDANSGRRRVGARVLSELSKPPARLRGRILERDRLESRREPLQGSEGLSSVTAACFASPWERQRRAPTRSVGRER